MIQLIGLLLPVLIDLVNRKQSDKDIRFWTSVAICSGIGIATHFITVNGFSGYEGMTMLEVADALSQSAMVMFGLAQLSYKGIWENSGTRNELGLKAN